MSSDHPFSPARQRDHYDSETARNIRAGMAEDHGAVPIRAMGQELNNVLWQNEQWAVTTYGLECRDGCYQIEKGRLLENQPDYGWPEHMSEKTWVRMDQFYPAFCKAVAIYLKTLR